MKKRFILNFFFVYLVQITCIPNVQEKAERNKTEIYSSKNYQTIEINFLKECSLKMDTCIKKCNEQYPYSYLENSNRENCNDRCVDQTINKEGCYMYYRSSRSNVFRAHTTK